MSKKNQFSIWCCSRQHKCRWQGFALHQGLGWGAIPKNLNEWKIYHDKECGGRLLQIVRAETFAELETPDPALAAADKLAEAAKEFEAGCYCQTKDNGEPDAERVLLVDALAAYRAARKEGV